MASVWGCEGISAALSSSHCTTYRNVRKNLQNPLATIALNFPSQLGKLSPHRRHLADLSFQGRGQRAWKWITALVWWFIMAFPWHQVLSYTDSALLILYTLIDVRELSRLEGGYKFESWLCHLVAIILSRICKNLPISFPYAEFWIETTPTL